MTPIKTYIEYLKNNPEGYWFKRKLYGWGWTPVKWQGFLVIGIFIALLIWNGVVFGRVGEPTEGQLTWFLVKTGALVALLIGICYLKGEKPRWQWGLPHEK